MPKLKTHKGLRKRVRVGARGAVKRKLAGGSHLMSTKNAKRRRRIRKGGVIQGVFAKKMRMAIGKA